jgi:molybdate transport system substrate-binding protein
MTDIHVFSGGAPKLVFNQLTISFERSGGHKVSYVFAVTKVLNDRLAAGEKPDALVLPTNILDGYQKDGMVRAQERAVFGLVSINAVVRKGAPKPDLSTTDRVKHAMLASRSLAMAPPGMTPSGTHMGKLIEKLGIAGALKGKLIHRPALEGGVELVESGEAEIGFYPKSEVISFEGLSIAGPLPPEIQLTTIYGAAVTTASTAPEAAAAFITFMNHPNHREIWNAGGFDPPQV